MAVPAKLTEYLDENQVKYEISSHSEAYTAQEVAATAHIRGRKLAKTVIARKGSELLMLVLPASSKVNFDALSEQVGGGKISLAREEDFKGLFPDCEVGAMPPFGNLYNIPVYVDETLRQDEEITFNAGTHREIIQMPYRDFERLAQAQYLKFSAPLQ